MPGYKNRVWEKISNIHSQYEEEKGMQGLKAGEEARRRLIEKQKNTEKAADEGLDDLIKKTADTSALQAINLS